MVIGIGILLIHSRKQAFHLRLILASDGLWDVVDEQMCVSACARATEPMDAARALCDLASNLGSMDNITVLVVAL